MEGQHVHYVHGKFAIGEPTTFCTGDLAKRLLARDRSEASVGEKAHMGLLRGGHVQLSGCA